ncbi:tetratricopeptide repeat protein [Leptothoe spongobia]|uniref:Tetratricopeptide repeat protein n=1 Tax=Leptothoe spongobia TAU-MAC 1115 TaxID=1967444 RepID=A0A947DGW9_9CYAN|nr:tetratricopeptide repeat protein [Leptothoe spongobia]MBT9316853.1 tetratricopeptide repeat protein [Leptothoe spongobia TAU-MAC 1115]
MPDVANQKRAQAAYQLGQQAFERGRYADAVAAFEQGIAHQPGISLDGELKLWLVNALTATDRRQEAIELCGKLARHPNLDVRKQSKQLLYIIQAPKLEAKEEWLTKIPDLATLEDSNEKPWQKILTKPRPPKPPPPPLPLSEVNTWDNGFAWVALIGSALLVGGLWWLG